jgi:hypothetical protein
MGEQAGSRMKANWVLVTHTSHPSNIGGWDQKDHGYKSAQSKNFAGHHFDGKSLAWRCIPVIPATAGSIK